MIQKLGKLQDLRKIQFRYDVGSFVFSMSIFLKKSDSTSNFHGSYVSKYCCFRLETHFIGFLDPKNILFDSKNIFLGTDFVMEAQNMGFWVF